MRRYVIIAKSIGLLIMLLGLSGLIGWACGIQALKGVPSNLAVMKAAAAVSFILAGAALLFMKNERIKCGNDLRELSIAVEHGPAIVIITDRDGNITYVNRKFVQVTGYSSKEALGRNPRFLKSGEQPKEFYEKLWRTILSGQEWRGQFHDRKKNGELYWERVYIAHG